MGAVDAVDVVVHRRDVPAVRQRLRGGSGGGQWNANISNYSLFEVAHAALTSVNNPHDKTEVADAIHNVNVNALAGPLDFASAKNPAPGVAITPPVGVQWQKGTTYPLEMKVVDNTLLPAGDDHRRPAADQHVTG